MYLDLGSGDEGENENRGESNDEINLSKCTCTCQRGEKENRDELRECERDEIDGTGEKQEEGDNAMTTDYRETQQ